MSANFQIYSPLPLGETAQAAVRTIRWRLMAPNSRALAVSSSSFGDFGSARLDVERFVGLHARGDVRLATGADDRWTWTLLVDGNPMAQSVRSYIRRLECEQGLNHVYRLTPLARPPAVLRVFGQHRGLLVDPAAPAPEGDRCTPSGLLAIDLPVTPGVLPKVVPNLPLVSREPLGSVTRSLRATTR